METSRRILAALLAVLLVCLPLTTQARVGCTCGLAQAPEAAAGEVSCCCCCCCSQARREAGQCCCQPPPSTSGDQLHPQPCECGADCHCCTPDEVPPALPPQNEQLVESPHGEVSLLVSFVIEPETRVRATAAHLITGGPPTGPAVCVLHCCFRL